MADKVISVELRARADQFSKAFGAAKQDVRDLEAQVGASSKGWDGLNQNAAALPGHIDRSSSRMDLLKGAIAGAVLAFGVEGAIRGVKALADAGSDLQETQSKTNVVFGEGAAKIEAWGDTAAASIGLSKQEAQAAASDFGNLIQSLGGTQDEALKLSPAIVDLSGDLASFHNLAPQDVLEKLRSGLVGEIEPLRSLSISFGAAEVEAKALEMGLGNVSGELTEGEKVQARYALILEQTTAAQGDFARTSEGLANQQRIVAAEAKDAAARIGTALLPAITEMVGEGGDLIPVLEQLALGVLPSLVSIFGDLAPLLGSTLSLLTAAEPVISLVAGAIDAIPTPLITVVGLAVALNKAIGPMPKDLNAVASSLGGLKLKATDAAASMTAGSVATAGLTAALAIGLTVWADAQSKAAEYRRVVNDLADDLTDVAAGQIDVNNAFKDYIQTKAAELNEDELRTLREFGLTFDDVEASILDGRDALDALGDVLKARGVDLDEMGIKLGKVDDSAQGMQELGDALRAAGFDVTTEELANLVEELEDWDDQAQAAAAKSIERRAAQKLYTDAMVDAAYATHTAADGAIDYVAALADLEDQAGRVWPVVSTVKDRIQDFGVAVAGSIDPIEDQEEAIKDTRTELEKLVDITNVYLGIILDVGASEREVRNSFRDFNDTVADGKERLKALSDEHASAAAIAEETARVNDDTADAIDGVIRKVADHIAVMKDNGASQEELQGFLALSEQSWRDDAEAAGISADKIDSVSTTIRNMPTVPPVIINAETASAEAALQRIIDRIATIARSAVNSVTAVFGGGGSSSSSGPGRVTFRASGGRAEAGEAYVVGEHRPELFVPDVSGTILPTVPAGATTRGQGPLSLDARTVSALAGEIARGVGRELELHPPVLDMQELGRRVTYMNRVRS